ncbi:MAG: hypothetical protein V4443_06230 [Pseudomonadota bacterium]
MPLLSKFSLACILSLSATLCLAAEKNDGDAKVVSGMSIVGNSDAPKSQYVVPWKAPEGGKDETRLTSNLLKEGLNPVDQAVFMRELDFYKLSNPN